MELSSILKIASIGWVGGAIMVTLIIHGEKLYAWTLKKFYFEVDEMVKTLDLMFIEITRKKASLYYAGYLISLFFCPR